MLHRAVSICITTLAACLFAGCATTGATDARPEALYANGNQALDSGAITEALELYDRCIDAQPAFALCYRAKAVAYNRMGRDDDTYDYYKLYLLANPSAKDAQLIKQLLRMLEQGASRS